MFKIIKGGVISNYLMNNSFAVAEEVKKTYLYHKEGRTNNPDSYFLTFPDNDKNRIIALPASIEAEDKKVSGIKWIASYPDNIEKNLQRASATLLLNDYETGYPIACLEASQISAHRTAASGAIAVEALVSNGRKVRSISLVGCGVLGQKIIDYINLFDLGACKLNAFDANETYADHFVEKNKNKIPCEKVNSLKEAFEAELVILTTTASKPYINKNNVKITNQIILNISLRDIDTDIIEEALNIVDDVDHCLKAQTSCHLTEQKLASRAFINAEIADLLDGSFSDHQDRAIVISPFGLGVLDLALAYHIYKEKQNDTETVSVSDFLPNMSRL